ncbi:MAG: hypothetical protein R6V04_16150 [bacterium]
MACRNGGVSKFKYTIVLSCLNIILTSDIQPITILENFPDNLTLAYINDAIDYW